MSVAKTQKYIETQAKTATKEQLLLMLLDGAMRFTQMARESMRQKRIEDAFDYFKRAQRIVTELICSLDKRVGEEIYMNLVNLYKFVYFRLVEASLKKDEKFADEAFAILSHLRQTWSMAIEKRQKENPNGHEAAPGARAECAISVQG
jgi:flagellar protein FliS